MKYAVPTCCFLLMVSILMPAKVFATQYREPIEITKQDEKKYGVRVEVYENEENPKEYTAEIIGCPSMYYADFSLSPRKNYNMGDKNPETKWNFDKNLIDSVYIILEFMGDDGQNYTIKLSTYIDK